MAEKPKNPAEGLRVWDVFDSVLVTTNGVYLFGFELNGLDSEHMQADVILKSAEILYSDLATQVPEQTIIQTILESHSNYDDVFERYEAYPKPDHQVLALQRRRRLEFLKMSNLRRNSLFMFIGSGEGFSPREFKSISPGMHRKKMAELEELAMKAKRIMSASGIRARELDDYEINNLIKRVVSPDLPKVIKDESEEPGGMGQNHCPYKPTLREELFQANISWDKSYVGVGDRYCRVLTLRDLPESTRFTDMEVFYHLGFDFILSVTIRIPSQQKYSSSLDQRRRLAKADSGKGGNIEDYKRTGRVREGEALAELLAESGQRLVMMSAQALVSSRDRKDLDRRTRDFLDRARSRGFVFFEESYAHDRELYHVVPGGPVTSDRYLLVTSNNAVDCLPVFQEDNGDKDPVMLIKTDRGELFSFNAFEERRDNWNATIFGASGSGKSVFVNLLIATSVLGSEKRGRLIVVDFAGPSKSSYLMISRLFGGQYVPVVSGENAINPFPPPEKAIDDQGNVRSTTESFLTILTDMLIANTGQSKLTQLFRHLIQKAVRDTYRRCKVQTPIYTDLFNTLKSYKGAGDVDQERLNVVIDLLGGFLESPASRLFNRRGLAAPEADFLILDLFGVDGLEPHVAQAITFMTTQWVKELAFDSGDPGYKYVILDEVAQLIKRPEMVNLLDELYSTARKHRTSVWTVTQSYQTYRASALASTVKLNSTTQMFLSHASDESGRRQIADDYQFSRREKHLFDGLRTVKGQYSSALVRTEVADPDGRDKHYLTTVLRVELSPLDYQICTSDTRDREMQRRFIEANPDRPLHEVLEYVAQNNGHV